MTDLRKPTRLTLLSHGAGCACKLSATELAAVLRYLPAVEDSRALVGLATKDDAAVYRISDDRAIVATVDFFTPIVDDPYAFGTISATNAFSDLYAMGATPLLALNLVAWPRDPEMLEVLGDVLRGGADVAARAGALVMGGHSVDDPEPKYGMVAIGDVAPDRVIANSGAQPGDILVLTKPLGTGVLSTALKRDAITEGDMADAIRSMSTLNDGAARAVRTLEHSVHAMTDVTGFGLLGHLRNMLESSRVRARLSASVLPVFERVRGLIERDIVPGGTQRNLEAAASFTEWAEDVTASDRVLMTDAQTSGGLLIAVEAAAADRLVRELQRFETPAAAIVGEILPAGDPQVLVEG